MTSNAFDLATFVPSSVNVRGIAKAWINFNGTGTIAARDSENVSSLTDVGTGKYTVSFTSGFGATDYAFSGSSADASKTYSRLLTGPAFNHQTYTSSAIAATIQRHDNQAYDDMDYVYVVTHGDLA